MKNKIILISGVVIILVGGLFLANNYKNKQVVDNNDNPYGKSNLEQETIDQLDDPLYQNQVTPDALASKLENKEDVTIYFYSPTCSYCIKTTPVLMPVAEDLDVDVEKLNLLEFPEEWDVYDIEGTPTVIHYRNGKEFSRISGQRPEAEFESFFKEFVLTE